MAKRQSTYLDPHQQALVKLIEKCARRHRRHEVFRNFCELAALSISNRVDLLQYDAREARNLEIIQRYYERDEVECFPRMLAHLVESFEGGHKDALGQIFEALQLADHYRGQFFYPVRGVAPDGQDAVLRRGGRDRAQGLHHGDGAGCRRWGHGDRSRSRSRAAR
ncbi:hypothetical protein [Ralstonia sp. A12]|uniref:hypothetical protein n=1 Tax=Ralstonia sp. A12 TaxID=1217052 RepID=UPI001E57CDFE|nr:hypothetical protein [Ralstonia sp. A12]